MSRITFVVIACAGALIIGASERASSLVEQATQYSSQAPKTILELQQFRQTSSSPVKSRSGRVGRATLVNLNPAINTWFLLQVAWNDGAAETAAHLENARPHQAKILLDETHPAGLVIADGKDRFPCELFGPAASSVLDQGKSSPLAYYPLCGGRLFLRNPTKGHRTALESAVEFLRDQVWGGENVIAVFHHLLADRYREQGELVAPNPASLHDKLPPAAAEGPRAALIDPQYAGHLVVPGQMGLALAREGPLTNGMLPGNWYAGANPGMWVSIIEPDFVAPEILQSYRTVVAGLDRVESSSLCYLIAFDLDQFDLEYALGTQHPQVNWSERVLAQERVGTLPGPDGIGSSAPLVSTALIRPDQARKTVAAFIGGFKRSHGAFRFGDFARRNHGSHYGFIQQGVVFSKLQPGLATVFVLDDGSVSMKTWTEADNATLGRVRHARQNGVPLAESEGVPGALVARWGPGNWSGSENDKLRSIRSSLAIQNFNGKHFLIYALFSDATPSAMARVFQAYQVNYGMLLDMNALEHTYLAVYRRSGSELAVDHLLKGMNQLDKSASNENVPRFMGYSDNRDFFYLMRRDTKEAKR
ncbi:MAG: hypothetical protein ABI693_16785 [Bryobacteraceae bacterium]